MSPEALSTVMRVLDVVELVLVGAVVATAVWTLWGLLVD